VNEDARLPRKSWIVGVLVDGIAKAYSFDRLKQESEPLKDQLGGRNIFVHYDSISQSAEIVDSEGKAIPSVQAYWFAWVTYYPNTELFQ